MFHTHRSSMRGWQAQEIQQARVAMIERGPECTHVQRDKAPTTRVAVGVGLFTVQVSFVTHLCLFFQCSCFDP